MMEVLPRQIVRYVICAEYTVMEMRKPVKISTILVIHTILVFAKIFTEIGIVNRKKLRFSL